MNLEDLDRMNLDIYNLTKRGKINQVWWHEIHMTSQTYK